MWLISFPWGGPIKKAFLSVSALALLILITALFVVLAHAYQEEFFHLSRATDRQELVLEARRAAKDLLDHIRINHDPQKETLLSVYEGRIAGGWDLHWVDHHSLINLNWVTRAWFERSTFKDLFQFSNPTGLQSHRVDQGLGVSLDHYREFFSEENLKNFFTTFGPIAISEVDEFSLEIVASQRVSNEAFGATLRNWLASLRSSQLLPTEDQLQSALGAYSTQFKGLITLEGWWNVNTLQERILRDLIAYPPYEIQNPETVFQRILDARSSSHITEENLPALLGLEPGKHAIFGALGTTSRFFSLRLSRDDFYFTILFIIEQENQETLIRVVREVITLGEEPLGF